MQEMIFLQLFERALSLDESFPVDLNPRWIKRQSNADADMMAKADVLSLKLSMINSAALISYGNLSYFGVSGFPNPTELPPGLAPTDLTPALFAIFVTALRLEAHATAAEIRDVVEGFSNVETDYKGHELVDVAALFPPLHFYEIDKRYIYTNSIERALGAYVARGYIGGPLRLAPASKQRFADLFENGPDTIPYQLPLRGLLSFSWPGLFIELYRCMEQLYSVPRITKLTEEWRSNQPIYNISKLLEEALAWRPKEDESLELLFDKLDSELCKAISRAIRTHDAQKSAALTARATARQVYALRNACVHFRPTTILHEMADKQWNDISMGMLDAVEELYRLYGKRFHEAEVVTP